MTLFAATRCVLLDVEGTTTPIAFVHEVLFPFAAARVAEACASAGDDPRIARALDLLRREHAGDDDPARPAAFGDGAAYARWLIERDRKSTGLKELQGIVWERGYGSGRLRAPVFPDVPPAFRRWREGGVRIRIYSSGSVLAQRLLFSHTEHGDLTPSIEAYHDTTTGPKKEEGSYRAIAEDARLEPGAILFLSDSREELDAAAAAGLHTAMMLRPGNPPARPGPHPALRDFAALGR